MTYKSTFEKYRASFLPDELTEEDFDTVGTFLKSQDFATMREWSADRTEVYKLGGQRFRMVVDRPSEGDDNQAVVVGGEFGNGIAPGAVTRARVVRDMVAPEATLVYQPNAALGQSNMNFTREERRKLRRGHLSPMVGRVATVLDAIGNPSDLTFYGPSQGGVVSLGYAAHPDVPAAAVAVVEVPSVVNRSLLGLVKDFAGSGRQLKNVVRANYEDLESVITKEAIDSLSVAGLAKFVAGALRRDNLAMSGVLRRGNAGEHMAAVLERGGSVVNAYGTKDRVSPLESNIRLAEVFAANPRYRDVRLTGADHSITNAYVLNGALARVAHRLYK